MPKTYADKLKNPRWQKKRLLILERDNWTCQKCGDTETSFHVHHKKYIHEKKPWQYDNEDLITYCSFCHEEENPKKEALWKYKEDKERLKSGARLFKNLFDMFPKKSYGR